VLYAFRYSVAALVAASVLNANAIFAVGLADGVGAVSDVTAVSETEEGDVAEVFEPGTIAWGEGDGDSEVTRAGSFPHPAKNNETLADRAIRRVFIRHWWRDVLAVPHRVTGQI
jgi:hypothetical protein